MENKKIISILLIIIAVCSIILIIKMNNKDNKIKNNNNNNITPNNTIKVEKIKNDVYIKEHKGYKDGFIRGTVINGTNKKIDYVKVTVDIYNKQGNKIANRIDIIENLNPGETWAFEIYGSNQYFIYKNLKVTYSNY